MVKIDITLMSIVVIPLLVSFYLSEPADLGRPETRLTIQDSRGSLVGTFYYPWWGGKNESYAGWGVDGHEPPKTWRSNYLPDMIPGKFDPAHELYSSKDIITVKKQLEWMKKAGIQFSIASWFGPGSRSDQILHKVVNTIMPESKNPYPGHRWTILYEDEGSSNPSLELLLQDLSYIREHFASSPHYLRIDGKPVVFVYNAGDSADDSIDELERWSKVKDQTGFYVVMKDDLLKKPGVDGYSMDGWYSYKPGLRFDQVESYSASASPGYWSYHDGEATLPRDLFDFERAVAMVASADVDFKLILTWNEWKEGTGIEPAQQIVHDDRNGFRPADDSYGESYVNVLARYFSAHD